MSVVAKMYVSEVARFAYNRDHVRVKMQVVTRGEANKDWAAATPAGSVELTVGNPAASQWFVDLFNSGGEVLVTFAADHPAG